MRPFLALYLLLMTASPAHPEISSTKLKKFSALPPVMENPANPVTEERVRLGRMLYFDPRFSKARDISCNSCHPLDRYGVDGTPVSTGHKGLKGNRNAPTVYNAAGHETQFWDGRAADVEQQAKGPVLNPVEMAMPSEEAVLAVIRSIPQYVEAFGKAFAKDQPAVTYDNFGRAIAAFERRLVTPSRWDRYLGGDKEALSAAEKKGFDRFYDVGCVDCHQGSLIGGRDFKRLGIEKPWPNPKDAGRFAVTKAPTDQFVFKIPSLRNIEKTGPYLHDGSVTSLEECVRLMGTHQLGRKLSDKDVDAIVTWMKTLTGDLPMDYIRAPQLP